MFHKNRFNELCNHHEAIKLFGLAYLKLVERASASKKDVENWLYSRDNHGMLYLWNTFVKFCETGQLH